MLTMDKTLDTQDFDAVGACFSEPSTDVQRELTSEPFANTPLTFPTSRRQAADQLGISNVMVGRLVKQLEEAGVTLTDHRNRLTEEGFNLLAQYQQSEDRATFLDNLQSQTPIRVESPEQCSSVTVLEQVRGEALALQGELVEGQSEYESNVASVTEGLSGLYNLADTLGEAIGDELSDRALRRASQRFNARFQSGIAGLAKAMGTRGK